MSDWQLVHDSRVERPEEVDKHSSPTTVYQRRNIVLVEVEDEQGKRNEWQYEQRELTAQEYMDVQDELAAQQRADIDYLAMETGVDL